MAKIKWGKKDRQAIWGRWKIGQKVDTKFNTRLPETRAKCADNSRQKTQVKSS